MSLDRRSGENLAAHTFPERAASADLMAGNEQQHRFDVEALRKRAGDKAFARGEAYHRDGQVELLAIEPQRVVALVTGSEDYRIELTGQGTNIGGECTCPAFGDWGFCKHLVATALAANDADDDEASALGALDRIRRHLATKDTYKLIEMIIGLAERDVTLLRDLDMAAATALDDDGTLFARFCKAIDDATLMTNYIHYREVRGWADEVSAVLDRIATFAADGRAALALGLADHALSRVEEAIRSIDDSDGFGGGLLERARDIHLDACGAARPDPIALARDLFARETEGESDIFSGAAALYADVLSDDGLAEFRRLASAAWAKLPPASGRRTTDEFSWERSRLEDILDFFAERDGDIDARIAIRARNLSSSRHYLELARFLLSHGREQEALRRAEEALWLFEDDPPDEQLIGFTVDLLLRAGRKADAETRLWHAFERRPSLQLYKQLRELAEEAARDRAIAILRARLTKSTARWHWDSPADLLVRLLMAEAMYTEAWQTAQEHGVSETLKETLATASEGTHPQRALAVYAARVDKLVSTGGNGNYEDAYRLIARMAPLRETSEQAAYVAELKIRYKSRRNFMKLLGVQ